MSQSESPRDFYHRLENGLSPLIRLVLAEHLPKIGGPKMVGGLRAEFSHAHPA